MTWHALIDVSRESEEPLTAQIEGRIRGEISAGVLHPGTRLPSSFYNSPRTWGSPGVWWWRPTAG